jgi:hypothetical protein
MNEDAEQLARRGQKGDPGERGRRGEAGMGRAVRRAVVYLFLVNFVLIAVGYLWLSHQAAATRAEFRQQIIVNNQKFCAVIDGFTSEPVPKPADPAANPSRETNYLWYARFTTLGHGLDCPREGR